MRTPKTRRPECSKARASKGEKAGEYYRLLDKVEINDHQGVDKASRSSVLVRGVGVSFGRSDVAHRKHQERLDSNIIGVAH